jgi:hypothetical protein
MGTTCASFHVLWRGSVDDAAKAISRAIVHPMHHIGKQVQPTISLVARADLDGLIGDTLPPARRLLDAVARGGAYTLDGGKGSRTGSGLSLARMAFKVCIRGESG